MHIVMISTWPPRFCGIATYAEQLVNALRKDGNKVSIISHTDGGREGESDVYPIIDMTKLDWYIPLIDKINELNPDVVHIQHEYGIFSQLLSGGRFDYGARTSFVIADFLYRLKVAKRPVVVTYHSIVRDLPIEEKIYLNHTLDLAAANIFHEQYQKDCLPWNIGRIPDNIFIVPHGMDEKTDISKHKNKYGAEGKLVIGTMGWWEPNKGVDRLIKWWPKIKKDLDEKAVLMIAGDVRPGSSDGPAYGEVIKEELNKCSERDSILLVKGAFSKEEYNEILSCFDVVVLPYTRATQSGNLAHAYALGIPAVVSAEGGLKSSIEDSRGGIVVNGGDDDFIETLVYLAKNEKLRERLSQNALNYVKNKISWRLISKEHLKVYEWSIEMANI